MAKKTAGVSVETRQKLATHYKWLQNVRLERLSAEHQALRDRFCRLEGVVDGLLETNRNRVAELDGRWLAVMADLRSLKGERG